MNARPVLYAALLPVLVFTGCKDKSATAVSTTPTAPKAPKPPAPEYQIGDHDGDGKLVVFAIGDRYRVLETEAALVFSNTGTETAPQASYDLCTLKEGHQHFSTLEDLVEGLKRLPAPRVVDLYSTCGAPLWYSLPEAEIERFFKAVSDTGTELRTERPDGASNAVCTCPGPGE